MGVVHKLKNPVVDFIVQRKREDPSLGCRQIAVMTGKKFSFRVSKSSVNAIIKKEALSSAVGRRRGWPSVESGRPGKFHIPPSKKIQISKEMQRAGIKTSGSGTQPSLQRLSSAPVQPYLEDGQAAKSHWPLDAIKDEVPQSATEKSQDREPLHQGMGFIFLKAAQWDLTGSLFWGKLFRKCTAKQLPLDFDAFCDMKCYLSLLGIADASRIGQFRNHGIWILNTLSATPTTDFSSFDWSGMASLAPSLAAEYLVERDYLSEEIIYFKTCLENGMILNVDPLMATVWGCGVAGEFSAPVNKAMTMLSQCLISNNRPAIFLGALGRQLSPEIYAMMAAMEGVSGKKMNRIIAVNHRNDPVAEFATIPRRKRLFMVGVWPWQKEFSGFVQVSASGVSASFYSQRLAREVLCRELNPFEIALATDERSRERVSLRMLVVFDGKGGVPQAVVLTNQRDGKPEDVLEMFFLRWPNLDKGATGSALRAGSVVECAAFRVDNGDKGQDAQLNCRDIFEVYQDFGKMLHTHCHHHFFAGKEGQYDLTSMVAKYYNLPGHCLVDDKNVFAFLRAPSSYSFVEELSNAAQCLNENAVIDPAGRRLYVNIIK